MQLKYWFITPQNSAEPLWIKLSIFCQQLHSVRCFLTHLLETKPELDNLLVIIVLLESLELFWQFLLAFFFPLFENSKFQQASFLYDEALGLPDPFFLATLPVVSKLWSILLIADREMGISSAIRVLYISEWLQLAWWRSALRFLTATPAWYVVFFKRRFSCSFTVGLTTLHSVDLSLLYSPLTKVLLLGYKLTWSAPQIHFESIFFLQEMANFNPNSFWNNVLGQNETVEKYSNVHSLVKPIESIFAKTKVLSPCHMMHPILDLSFTCDQ